MTEPLQSPYTKGSTLTLSVTDIGKKSPLQLENGSEIRVKIVDVMEPATMSVIAIVELESPQTKQKCVNSGVPSKMILKLYDRRFALDLREEIKVTGPATRATEDEFVASLRQGSMPRFLAKYEENDTLGSGDWDTPMKEAYFSIMSTKMHQTETKVYDCLTDLQGIHVPTFYANLDLATEPTAGEQLEESITEHTRVRAILIEHISGFLLSDLVTETSESEWPVICTQAIEAVNKIIDFHFINPDLQPRNAIVHRREERSYQIFYIDFGMCYFRDPSDTDERWRERKRQRGEEAAVGGSLALTISKAKGKKGKPYKGPLPLPWAYIPSGRFEGQYLEL
ncbi:unnamed protein product [Clonostachys solani]|uniref:Protein kinase domain-containing protein n=1 Tax=Clonostachys solani TaxID=160281 RepID=A0A9N9Z9M7_9HYPO|nr:unnamed protein product [Clonostachys solani]